MVSYAMAYLGQAALWISLVTALCSAVLLFSGHVMTSSARAGSGAAIGGRLTNYGYIGVFATAAALFVCCFVIVQGFFTHNIAIQYVAQNYPTDTGSLFWLYQLAGLWASRSGSLLTWGTLIALFAAWVAWHRRCETDPLSNVALAVMMVVLLFFIAVMLFSSSNSPFIVTDPSIISDGELTGAARAWGMNVLLEHWAMAIHPPTLFIGYAGMTVPFAYAIASLVCNDMSRAWIDLCNRVTLFAFIFLTLGIGLGAVWAYVVLGWGGYWGWDPVENASLLSWLTAVAMIHSFTAMRKRSQMRGWCLFTAMLTFVFVILGTFITRSGIVQSVHAFSSDPVSMYLFLAIMVLAVVATGVLYLLRRKDLASEDDIESVASKNGSYYLTNIIMVFSGILLAYLTVSSALPTWLPAGGMSVGAMSYEAVARPLGVAFLALAAVCPFLGWKRTDAAQFAKNVRIPAIIGLVVFALLMVEFVLNLLPVYSDTIARGGVAAEDLASMGPAWYYNGLAVVALLVASLLFANSAYLIVRGVRGRMGSKGESAPVALLHLFAKSPAQAGGYLTHLGMGIILVGLVGSSMYVTDMNLLFSEEGERVPVGSYELVYRGESRYVDDDQNMFYSVTLDSSRDGRDLGQMTPSLEYTAASFYGQTRVSAEVRNSPLEDLFVAFQGYEADGSAVVNARVNPLISLVWIGFFVAALGIVCATVPRRGTAALVREQQSPSSVPAPSEGQGR